MPLKLDDQYYYETCFLNPRGGKPFNFSCHLYLIRKEECDAKPHSSEFLNKEFSAGCQPRYPVKIPITTWKSLSPPRGLQLFPSCQARCPVKTSNATDNYPAPSAAQLLTMLLHREHFCSYLYNTQFSEKINTISNME